MFKEELWYQFGKSEGWAPEKLAKLRQTGTVAEYRVEFFKLGNQCKGIPEGTLVGLSMAGLRPEIAAVVQVFEPDSLRTAFRLAGNKEEELASWRGVRGRYQKPSGGGSGLSGRPVVSAGPEYESRRDDWASHSGYPIWAEGTAQRIY
ncbi:unnamed protein product [Linum trigynum]|uniref:Retrotransposon gag domain-containing protein n=1 Tax=Linum trigynum TaxID=586398 RepID=A0AAV2GEI9_9ROSI